MHVQQSLFTIGLVWMAYFFVRQHLTRTQAVVRRRNIAAFDNRVPRLCGYHTGALLRPGQVALLDSVNCEVCNAER